MNSAVSIWFSQLKQFLDKGCDEAKISFTPMNKVMVLWQYSGHGELTQGHMDIHILRRFLLTLSDREGKIWLNDFVTNYFDSESNKRDVMRKDEQERARKVTDMQTPYIIIRNKYRELSSHVKLWQELQKWLTACRVFATLETKRNLGQILGGDPLIKRTGVLVIPFRD